MTTNSPYECEFTASAFAGSGKQRPQGCHDRLPRGAGLSLVSSNKTTLLFGCPRRHCCRVHAYLCSLGLWENMSFYFQHLPELWRAFRGELGGTGVRLLSVVLCLSVRGVTLFQGWVCTVPWTPSNPATLETSLSALIRGKGRGGVNPAIVLFAQTIYIVSQLKRLHHQFWKQEDSFATPGLISHMIPLTSAIWCHMIPLWLGLFTLPAYNLLSWHIHNGLWDMHMGLWHITDSVFLFQLPIICQTYMLLAYPLGSLETLYHTFDKCGSVPLEPHPIAWGQDCLLIVQAS